MFTHGRTAVFCAIVVPQKTAFLFVFFNYAPPTINGKGEIMKNKKMQIKKFTKGFTLLELLVVVLIIGILASIALPQYKMAVTKAKVASILPLMRRWKDALQEYELQHGYYVDENGVPDGATLGVNWPSDWTTLEGDPCGNSLTCKNDYWQCLANSVFYSGEVFCVHDNFLIMIHQPDYDKKENIGLTCQTDVDEGKKICKSLGGTETGMPDLGYEVYKLKF